MNPFSNGLLGASRSRPRAAAGSYDLYARWTASSANSAAASYTVVHGAGTAVVTVNQKQNGGQWRYLGSYGFEPDAGHQVTLAAGEDGDERRDPPRKRPDKWKGPWPPNK